MARFGFDQSDNGRLDIRPAPVGNEVEAFFIPTEPPQRGTPAANRAAAGVKLLSFEPDTGLLRIYPTNTLAGSPDYLGPKYSQIHTLTIDTSTLDGYFDSPDFDAILEVLPPGFIKDHAYGLGLLKDCNRFIRLVEEHSDCTEIAFNSSYETAAHGTEFQIGLARFNAIWSELVRINSRGNRAAGRVKDAFVHNDLAATLSLEPKDFSLGRHPVSRTITKAASGVEELSELEQDALIETLTSGTAAIAKVRPEKFQKLHREIELVSLERLIEAYADALDQNKNEGYWQTFFDDNAFALQQVFGAPMIGVQSGATVGGGGFSGGGDKIADYLFKNSLTNNVALVEIKKPTTPLLRTIEYRAGVFGASKELNGAVTQVLDQAYQLTKSLPALKDHSRRWDLESYAVACFVVAGRTPSADEPAKQKSLELYRANSRNVTIVTYDEILERLKLLREFLMPQPDEQPIDTGQVDG